MVSVDEGLTPPSLSSLPSLTFVDTIYPFWNTRVRKPIPGFEIDQFCPFWTRRRRPIPGFQMEQICRFWTPGESRFQESKSNRVWALLQNVVWVESKLRQRTEFRTLHIAQQQRCSRLRRVAGIFIRWRSWRPESESVGQPGSPSFFCLQALSRAKKERKGWLNYHHRKQRKGKEGVFGLCHTSGAKERSF